MMNNNQRKNHTMNTLFVLVVFVFFILLISITISAGLLIMMRRFGLLQPLTNARLPAMLTFLLLISLLVGLVITYLVGNASLRPLKRFIDATREIAAGNFDVRVETIGPEEFNRLANSFNEMAKELGSIETLRDDFVNNISHEYKTPVVSIRGFAKLLKKGNLTEAERNEYLDIIISESDRLTQLSSNVLLLSKLNSTDKMTDISEYSLDEQLRRVILVLDQHLEEKRIELNVELAPCKITSNQELLQQVWMNLLNNAIKFTPEGGKISVELKNHDGYAQVEVRDNGIGMDAEDLKHIFDKFYQGDRSRFSQGNGLGLTLVKKIVDLCGGAIDAKSEVGKGSAFTINLPI